ncbi:PAN domain protein [Necator americanus]|uniref:PAN domain protein n=1 Tax=Necator americanus TaxID=51031 RepID=W2SQ60_NECAM|nr:PAN domain protein [Necator americanus]ETN71750.1 PAN domain protein [Necator americanus]
MDSSHAQMKKKNNEITSLLTCTFFRVEHGFNAAVKYQITLRSRDTCLQTCYDEKDCNFLEYDGVLCTIFKEGSGNQQSKGGEVFKLDRQRTISSCPSVVVVPPDIPFQTIQAGVSAGIGSCADVPNDATSIFIYRYNDATVFYSNRQGFLPNVTFPSGR